MPHMIQTKIIATIGPASDSPEMLARLLDSGVDVFRLNFSHGTLEQHARTFDRIRSACAERGSNAAIMADLCGPKIRIDPVENDGFKIAEGDSIDIVAGHIPGTPRAVSTNRPEIVREAQVGNRILIDDGSVMLRVTKSASDSLTCVCEAGGRIATRKGVNLPDSKLVMSAMTDKDREDLAWAIEHRVDYVALSFVRSAADLKELRELLPLRGDACLVIAKIETLQACDHLDEIVEASDVILVARGDLGVEADLARVPILQKQIVARCQQAGKPVIVATQMLQSMISSPTATRAEVSDVANAILDGADGVMLSGETSVGEYPERAVKMLVRIAEQTEDHLRRIDASGRLEMSMSMRRIATAVAHGANLLARELGARLVVVWTQTGNTARLLSKCRLNIPVIGLSPNQHVCRRMSMYYGVVPICLVQDVTILKMLHEVDAALIERRLADPDDPILVIAGTRLDQPGATNALLIHLVGNAAQELPELI
jgi:pyruvate kinase